VIFEPQVIEQQFNERLKEAFDDARGMEQQDPTKISSFKKSLYEVEEALMNKEMRATPMQLLVKNNLTVIEAVALQGYGSSGVLELYDMRKVQNTIDPPIYSNHHHDWMEYRVRPTEEDVSVWKAHTKRVIGMQQVDPYLNMHGWMDLTPEKPAD